LLRFVLVIRPTNSLAYMLMQRFFIDVSRGSMFWTWFTIVAASQAIYNRKMPLIWRGALGVMVLITLYVSVIHPEGRAWTSGWMPALAGLGVIAVIGYPLVGGFGGVGAIVFGMVKLQSVVNAVMIGDNQYSLSTRTVAWELVLKLSQKNLIFGIGPAQYYWYTPLFPILGYAVQFNSHNNYVDMISQIGIVGIACYFWFMTEVGVLGLKLIGRVPEGFPRAYVIGALGGLVGTVAAGMLGDWVIPFVYNVGYAGFRASVLAWLFLGGLGLMEQLYPHKTTIQEVP
jgi:hypothetical protein